MKKLTEKLQYTFQKQSYFKEALTHKSAGTPHNERLEFLGDAILDLVITEALFKQHPNLSEGKLSTMRAALVKREPLAELAESIHLGDALLLGKGELQTGGAKRPSMLANAMEAVFGAIYLDGGLQAAQKVVLTLYKDLLSESSSTKDSKTALQEFLQKKKLPLASYTLSKTEGKAHAQYFHVTCVVNTKAREYTTKGSASSKKHAEQLAARAMLKLLEKA